MMRLARCMLMITFMTIALALLSCEREHRRFREIPPGATANEGVRQSELQPGQPKTAPPLKRKYVENAWGVS